MRGQNIDIFQGSKLLFLVLSVGFLISCSSTKRIQQEDKILGKNVFKLTTDDARVNIGALKNELDDLVLQKPVKKNALNPRTWGKPLTIYDRKQSTESIEIFTKFLRNRKGFYNAQLNLKERVYGNRLDVSYEIDLRDRSYISSIKYESPDTELLDVIEANGDKKLLIVGEPLDSKLFDRERVRIVDLLKDHGYALFNGNFIEFRGDSLNQDVNISLFIYTPVDQIKHKKFHIGEVNVYTEHLAVKEPYFNRVDSIVNTSFYSKTSEFVVEPKTISKILTLNSGDTFVKSEEARTNRNLSRLSPYRFVTLEPFLIPGKDSSYNYNIFLTPHDNKWVFDMGANVFYSSFSQISDQDLIGFNGNIGLENRNFAKNAISHRFGLESILEFNISSLEVNSLSLQLNNTFEIPRVIDIFNMTRVMNNLGLIDDRTFNSLSVNGNTRADFGFGVTNILQFYNLNSFNASWSYNFQSNARNRIVLKQIGINVLDTKIKPRFQEEILKNNPLLERSFQDYMFTGFLFREISLFHRTAGSLDQGFFSFIGNFELSGLENLIVNKFVNLVSPYNNRWKLAGLEFSEFIRLESDIRFNKRVKPRSSLAARFDMAVAIPYGDDEVVPFVKQFFVGGPNSIRGWQLRELGPGSYKDLLFVNGQPFYQTGDFKLELNVEYRFDLFWFWEGAVFFDAGNVWTLKKDTRIGTQFSSKFLDEVAMSVGWGIRFDFDYFLLRLDIGYKLRNPYPDESSQSRFVLLNKDYNKYIGNINFAINYPF